MKQITFENYIEEEKRITFENYTGEYIYIKNIIYENKIIGYIFLDDYDKFNITTISKFHWLSEILKDDMVQSSYDLSELENNICEYFDDVANVLTDTNKLLFLDGDGINSFVKIIAYENENIGGIKFTESFKYYSHFRNSPFDWMDVVLRHNYVNYSSYLNDLESYISDTFFNIYGSIKNN